MDPIEIAKMGIEGGGCTINRTGTASAPLLYFCAHTGGAA
jgi:hypothetical protein